MDIEVVVGQAKACSDLASRLAMVYRLLLRIAEQVGTQPEIDEKGSKKPHLNNQIAA